jgi:molybdopterin/thiamine biosynthesis adenylyltransferase
VAWARQPGCSWAARAWVTLTVVDHDVVDATNLQRQIAHNLARVGQPKAESMRAAIAAINPDVVVHTVTQRADDALLAELVAQADVVLDCTDNFTTRHAINHACFAQGKPLVSGAAIRMDGQLSVYDPRDATSPCYACVFPQTAGLEETRCATMGVFAPLVGIVGTMQAAEALKIASGIGSAMAGRLLMLDGRPHGVDRHPPATPEQLPGVRKPVNPLTANTPSGVAVVAR